MLDLGNEKQKQKIYLKIINKKEKKSGNNYIGTHTCCEFLLYMILLCQILEEPNNTEITLNAKTDERLAAFFFFFFFDQENPKP